MNAPASLPSRLFGADTLTCALTLAGRATPTPAELTTALAEMYPTGTAPEVSDLLAVGWLEYTVDGHRLRQPPLSPADVAARLATADKYDKTGHPNARARAVSRREAGVKSDFCESLKKTDNRNKTGLESDESDRLKKTESRSISRNKAGIESDISDSLNETDSREIAGGKVEFLESLKKEENRQETDAKPEFSESLKKGESNRITDAEPPTPPVPETHVEQLPAPRLSYYRGGIATTTPYAAITPAQLFAVLTSTRYRPQTEALRAAPVGSPQRAELKKCLDYVTPAGIFTRRANDALVTASGLLVLDFDHLSDLAAARAALLADEQLASELALLFTSPSGDGLKAFVHTDPTASHLENFRAYANYLAALYAPLGLRPDEAGKDVARACFVPYAPDAWLAPAYAV